MKARTETYPERIRSLAAGLSQFRNLYPVDSSVDKLRTIADELEQILKKPPLKRG
jgi:hypothetical protein